MILTKIQQETIKLLSQSELSKSFYWTGGTLLATHYLHHRLSEDLDFFSENHFSFENINPFIQELKQKIGFKQVTSTKIFLWGVASSFHGYSGQTLAGEFQGFPIK